ncbi:MAG TPA: NERD domain-containing protein [bacterium]|nr:NERD domain-containing protein [bacterium]
MIPELNPCEIKNEGEKIIYEAFHKQLPEHWSVRYSLNFCLELNKSLSDGEIDFIIMAPEYGLMFVEVKEFNEYKQLGGKWYCIDQKGKKFDKNPFEQVVKAKHIIISHFCKLLKIPKHNFPGIYGHVVMFPNSISEGPKPSTFDPCIFINRNNMNDLRNSIIKSFEMWSRDGVLNQFHNNYKEVEKLIVGDADFIPIGAAESDSEKINIEELTKMQYESFRAILSNKRVHIKGVAGTGKTMLAIWGANVLVEQKKKVLYLCYNTLLASWIKAQNRGKNLQILSFFDLCKTKVKQHNCGIFKVDKGETDFFEKRAVLMTLDAVSKMNNDEKYDAIFVDEAQDFHNSWWEIVTNLLRNPEKDALYLFYDPKQKLFRNDENRYPEGIMCELDRNCRNTRKISAFCGHAIKATMPVFQFSPEGNFPEILPAIEKTINRAMKIKEIVSAWLVEGYLPSQIAIISPWSVENDRNSFKHFKNVNGIPLESNEEKIQEWIDGKVILARTIKSFKGLESDCLVIVDIPQLGTTGFNDQDLYVAASRAKSRLALIPISSEAERMLIKMNKTDGDANE